MSRRKHVVLVEELSNLHHKEDKLLSEVCLGVFPNFIYIFFLNSVGCHGVFRGTITLVLVFSRI